MTYLSKQITLQENNLPPESLSFSKTKSLLSRDELSSANKPHIMNGSTNFARNLTCSHKTGVTLEAEDCVMTITLIV